MTIPALSTADKLFICSYNIESNIDHRYAIGVINELTTVTDEYIDGYCWIPVKAPQELVSHSWFYDLPDKSTCYVKIGCRVSADGYLHSWLLDTQKVSELILWNNAYNTDNQPGDDTTVLHWVLEKLYYEVNGHDATGWTAANIKFQTYIATATTLYLFGNYNNSLTNAVQYTAAIADVLNSDFSWYPNNSTTVLSDYLYDANPTWSLICARATHSGGTTDWSQSFGKSPDQVEPKFWKITEDTAVISISALCDPTTSRYKQTALCHSLTTIGVGENWTAVGNNSGRNYSVSSYGSSNCAAFTCTTAISRDTVQIDMEPNRAYLGSGTPEDPYTCDPGFTYDSSVSFTYKKFTSVSATAINYLAASATFSGIDDGTLMVAEYYYPDALLDSFNEAGGATDELKHGSATDAGGNTFYSLFTHHVGIGLVTKEASPAATIDTADWIVTWSGSNYFTGWTAPDGLAARDPGTTNAILIRPLTHHDEFDMSDDIQGGFLYDLLTSAGFDGRDPGTETKRTRPAQYNDDFNDLFSIVTSAGFDGRDPGTVAKRSYMGWFNSDFEDLFSLVTSAGFAGRDPGELPLRGNPGTYNMDFCNTGNPWLIHPFSGGDSALYARDGSIVAFGNSYSTLIASTQTIGKVYEGAWLDLIIAGDQDNLGNTVAELSTKCRVYVGGGWKSVPRVGDSVGDGIIITGCPFFIEGGSNPGIHRRYITVEAGVTAQSKITHPTSYNHDFSDLFALLDSGAFDSRDPTT